VCIRWAEAGRDDDCGRERSQSRGRTVSLWGEVGRWRVCIATDRYSGERRDKVGE
jgi:hypothetical protein